MSSKPAPPASPAAAPSTPANPTEERSARVAVTVFPVLVLIAAFVGYVAAPAAKQIGPYVNPLLMVIMFGMGLTLTIADFRLVLRHPVPIFVGVLAQFLIMPLLGFAVAKAMQLPPDLAAGVILVGCAPSGTSSNVVNYLSRNDTALSVAMTSVTTLLAPIITPLLCLLLAGQYMPVDGAGMAVSIVQVVLVPVLLGLVLRLVAPRLVDALLPAMPWLSVVAIAAIVAAVVGGSATKVAAAGAIVFVAVVIHNGLGYLLGYWLSRALGQTKRWSRTISVEVGMQNSGLAAGLAAQYFNPVAALPAAIFSIWHNLSGAMLAAYYRRTVPAEAPVVSA